MVGKMSRFRVLAILLFVFTLLSSYTIAQEPNELISNGVCYFSPGNEADSIYIPCGNEDLGHVSCCQHNDKCMKPGTCFNGQWYVTYVAGCTDDSYSDPSCPGKGLYNDQQWVGLSYCNGTSDEWVWCNNTESESNTVTSPSPCWCPGTSRTVALTAPNPMTDVAVLPASTGLSLTAMTGWTTPTAVASSASSSSTSPKSGSIASSTSSRPSITTSLSSSSSGGRVASSAGATPASPAPSTSNPALSTSAKAGIGVGAAAAGVIAFALLWLLATIIRRHKKNNILSADSQIRPRSQAFASEKDTLDELDPRSPTWSGHKSELPGEDRNSASIVSPISTQGAWTRPTSAEVEGTIPKYQSLGSLRSQAMGDGGPVYKPYRKADAPPVGMQAVPESDRLDSMSTRPGRRTGSVEYEMPAQVPGSTLPR